MNKYQRRKLIDTLLIFHLCVPIYMMFLQDLWNIETHTIYI